MLAGEPKDMRNVDDDEDEEVNIRRDFHMVMPASYVSRIDIPFEGMSIGVIIRNTVKWDEASTCGGN